MSTFYHRIGAAAEPVTDFVTDDPGSAAPIMRDHARTRQAVLAARLLSDLRDLATLVRDHGHLLAPRSVLHDLDALECSLRIIRDAVLATVPWPPVVAGRLDQAAAP